MSDKPFWAEGLESFLAQHAPQVETDQVIETISSGRLRVEWPLADGSRLIVARLHHAVVEREEIFLGNVLFNDWLNKSLRPAIEQAGLGQVYPVNNELESAYFVLITRAEWIQVIDTYSQYLTQHLPELLFGNGAPEKGLHGDFSKMLDFERTDLQPFPIYAVPLELMTELEKRVREIWKASLSLPLVKPDRLGQPRSTPALRKLGSILAFFYSHPKAGERQSYRNYLARMATEYQVISIEELQKAFRLPDGLTQTSDIKDNLDTAIQNGAFDQDAVRAVFSKVLAFVEDKISSEPSDIPPEKSWQLAYDRSEGNLAEISIKDYIATITSDVLLGGASLNMVHATEQVCRVCGRKSGFMAGATILFGQSFTKFHNQTSKQDTHNLACLSCALYSYLMVKQVTFEIKGRKYPVPRLSNIIFHYGRHSQQEVEIIGQRAKKLVAAVREVRSIRSEAFEKIKKQKKGEKDRWTQEQEARAIEAAITAQIEAGQDYEANLARLNELYEQLVALPQAQEVIAKAEDIDIVDLGLGKWRLLGIVLGKLPTNAKERPVAQTRFERNRLTIFSLLSFLAEQFGDDGPFYFQSTPRPLSDASLGQRDTFYIRDRAISASRYRRQYKAITEFAASVTKGYGTDGLEARLKLAEKLEADPLETFSAVLRDSPINRGREQDDKYNVLKPIGQDELEWDTGTKSFELWGYLRAYEMLHQMAQDQTNEH